MPLGLMFSVSQSPQQLCVVASCTYKCLQTRHVSSKARASLSFTFSGEKGDREEQRPSTTSIYFLLLPLLHHCIVLCFFNVAQKMVYLETDCLTSGNLVQMWSIESFKWSNLLLFSSSFWWPGLGSYCTATIQIITLWQRMILRP